MIPPAPQRDGFRSPAETPAAACGEPGRSATVSVIKGAFVLKRALTLACCCETEKANAVNVSNFFSLQMYVIEISILTLS